jgi:hypothetical protein
LQAKGVLVREGGRKEGRWVIVRRWTAASSTE